MSRRLLDDDTLRRIRQIAHVGKDGSFGIQKQQDVEPVLDAAREMRELQSGMRWGDGKHVAHVPDIIVERMMRDPRLFPDDELAGTLTRGYKIRDMKKWKGWLNNSDNKLFRTFEGRI